jgi:hypothetical protein
VLRRRADTGGHGWAVCGPLRERGHQDDLRRRANAGDGYAMGELVALMRERGDIVELRRRADRAVGRAIE